MWAPAFFQQMAYTITLIEHALFMPTISLTGFFGYSVFNESPYAVALWDDMKTLNCKVWAGLDEPRRSDCMKEETRRYNIANQKQEKTRNNESFLNACAKVSKENIVRQKASAFICLCIRVCEFGAFWMGQFVALIGILGTIWFKFVRRFYVSPWQVIRNIILRRQSNGPVTGHNDPAPAPAEGARRAQGVQQQETCWSPLGFLECEYEKQCGYVALFVIVPMLLIYVFVNTYNSIRADPYYMDASIVKGFGTNVASVFVAEQYISVAPS